MALEGGVDAAGRRSLIRKWCKHRKANFAPKSGNRTLKRDSSRGRKSCEQTSLSYYQINDKSYWWYCKFVNSVQQGPKCWVPGVVQGWDSLRDYQTCHERRITKIRWVNRARLQWCHQCKCIDYSLHYRASNGSLQIACGNYRSSKPMINYLHFWKRTRSMMWQHFGFQKDGVFIRIYHHPTQSNNSLPSEHTSRFCQNCQAPPSFQDMKCC